MLTKKQHAELNRLIAAERKAQRAILAYWVEIYQKRQMRRRRK